MLVPTLLYYGGGWLQYGYRYALDSIPFIWALCGLAAARDERVLASVGITGPAIGVGWRLADRDRRRRRARRRVLGLQPLAFNAFVTTGRGVVRAERPHGKLPAMRHPRLVLAIFILSGAAGLMYEVVWSRQLVLVFGNTTQAVSTILTGFFGGMAIGSVVGGRLPTGSARRSGSTA